MAENQEEKKFSRTIEEKQQRKLAARKKAEHPVWFGLGMFGLVGWSVAIPTVIGIFTGLWLDKTFPGRPSWTLTLLFCGVITGCWNAWYWIKRESRKKD
ncbi:MAG TPA: AtpZ/AtpI family protein [Desulfotignum sp.]|nr:AtpZ/AtpI family protein [Desulfotignum sp.]